MINPDVILDPVENPEDYFDMRENFNEFVGVIRSKLNTGEKLEIIELIGTSAIGKTSFINMVIQCLFHNRCPEGWKLEKKYEFANQCYSYISFLPILPAESVWKLINENMVCPFKDKQRPGKSDVVHIFIDELDRLFFTGTSLDKKYMETLKEEINKIIEELRVKKIIFYFVTSLPIIFENFSLQDKILSSLKTKPSYYGAEQEFILEKRPRIYLDLHPFKSIAPYFFQFDIINREKIDEQQIKEFIRKVIKKYGIEDVKKAYSSIVECVNNSLLDNSTNIYPIYYIKVFFHLYMKDRVQFIANCEDLIKSPYPLLNLYKSYYRMHWDDLTTQHGLLISGLETELYREFKNLLDKGKLPYNNARLTHQILVKNNVATRITTPDNQNKEIHHIWKKFENLGRIITSVFENYKKNNYSINIIYSIPRYLTPPYFLFYSFFLTLLSTLSLPAASFIKLLLNFFPNNMFLTFTSQTLTLIFFFCLNTLLLFYYSTLLKSLTKNTEFYFPVFVVDSVILMVLYFTQLAVHYLMGLWTTNYVLLFIGVYLSLFFLGIVNSLYNFKVGAWKG